MAGFGNAGSRSYSWVGARLPPNLAHLLGFTRSRVAKLSNSVPLHRPMREAKFCARRLAAKSAQENSKSCFAACRRPRYLPLTAENVAGFLEAGSYDGFTGVFAWEYRGQNSRSRSSVVAVKVGHCGATTGRAEKSRVERQKGLDFQREESVSVLAGGRRVRRQASLKPRRNAPIRGSRQWGGRGWLGPR